MTTQICLLKIVPTDWLELWSQATNSEEHLTPETPQSLGENLLVAAVAISNKQPVGFGGLITARTNQGYGLKIDNQAVAELGGAYILPKFRGKGIWKRLAITRIRYATKNNLKVVCITGNPIVQAGLKEIGATPLILAKNKEILEKLCLKCSSQNDCGYCPLQPQTSWLVA